MSHGAPIVPRFVIGHAAMDRKTQEQWGVWFICHFSKVDDLRKAGDLGIQWGIYAAGKRNAGSFVANQRATSASILVAGCFGLNFFDREDSSSVHSVDLLGPSQYALLHPGVEHDWRAIADSPVITIRWPSLAGNQANFG